MHSLKSYSFQVCELLDTGTFLAVVYMERSKFLLRNSPMLARFSPQYTVVCLHLQKIEWSVKGYYISVCFHFYCSVQFLLLIVSADFCCAA